MENSQSSKVQDLNGDRSIAEQRRFVQWQQQTVEELSHAIPLREQMVVSILAAAWRTEAGVWEAKTLKSLLSSFARDVNTATEHRIVDAIALIDSGTSVMESLTSMGLVGELTGDAVRIAIANKQLSEFLACWQTQPIAKVALTPHEQTFTSKLMRFLVTGLFVLNVLAFVMLFIIPEFQKMFEEFGIEMVPAALILMKGSDFLVFYWFVPALLLLLLGIFYFRGSTFGIWWNRWFPNSWTVSSWAKKDRTRLVTAWKLRPVRSTDSIPWEEQLLSKDALTKSESAALSATNDKELRDWLLENMVTGRRENRARAGNRWATIVFGIGHCLLGGVVFLLALSVFGSLLVIIEGLTGAHP